ncbi:MAG: glycerophosphodiester phosphodiesterase family protein [Candidatus Hydrogenedentota bacterium]
MHTRRVPALLVVLAALCCSMAATAEPVVIAHRGASGYLPEHTLEAYAYAHALGADFIEPDLVLTKDDVLVALHDIHLESTTEVEMRFPDRARDDGKWYAADFTLAELKSLAVHERLPNRFPMGDAAFCVPTFVEVIELVQGLNKTTGRTAGIYPELKQPSWHKREGRDMLTPFVKTLRQYGYDKADAPIFIQCFEHRVLKKLRDAFGVRAPMIALVGGGKVFDQVVSADGLDAIAAYAQGIGPDKGRVYKDPGIVTRAHARGLDVHPYTLRADSVPGAFADFAEEMHTLFVVHGADGAFTDFTDHTRAFIDAQDWSTAPAP